jgi:creatinine amidohydrolase/Fe(II)-dependent formamide hydrolase-like protein
MGHSGELETSLMLYLAPELVDLTALPEGFRSDRLHHSRFISGEGITRYVNIKEHSEIGVDGFPAAASAKDGELFYQTVLTELAKVVRELQQEE